MKPFAIFTLFICIAAVLSSCEATPVELDVELYAVGGGFEGLYTIDGEDEEATFSSSETTSDIYRFSATVEVEERIVIDVFPNSDGGDDGDSDVTSLTCRIWSSDDIALMDETYSIDSTSMKTFIYEVE